MVHCWTNLLQTWNNEEKFDWIPMKCFIQIAEKNPDLLSYVVCIFIPEGRTNMDTFLQAISTLLARLETDCRCLVSKRSCVCRWYTSSLAQVYAASRAGFGWIYNHRDHSKQQNLIEMPFVDAGSSNFASLVLNHSQRKQKSGKNWDGLFGRSEIVRENGTQMAQRDCAKRNNFLLDQTFR